MDDHAHTASEFAGWLQTSMLNRGLRQAQLARSVGVADTQVSRWRRGQVVPNVHYLQRLADTFGIQRVMLDRLVGLPVGEAAQGSADVHLDPEMAAELDAHQARLRQVLVERLPRSMWRAYIEACVALADGLSAASTRILADADGEVGDAADDPHPPERPLGFRP